MKGRRCAREGLCRGVRFDGHRMTKPRTAILKVFEKGREHLSAEDIYLNVHRSYPNIGLTTVYRNLEFLVRKGVLSKFDFGHGRSKYELSEAYNPLGHHHQLVCERCMKVINYNDFMEEELRFVRAAEKGLEKRYRFKIRSHVIQFHGLCEKCGRT